MAASALHSPCPVLAEPCACDAAYLESHPGVLYHDTRVPSFDEVARMLAPVLWFSPDEPLLLQGIRTIPSAHPCDEPARGAVVYYQVVDVVLRGTGQVTEPPETDRRFFEKVELMSLRFFFYYPRDIGKGGHVHDIEGAEFDVALGREPGGCNTVRLVIAKAFAHGQPWYSNRLKATTDTRYPLTVLVEEGKHASCTDRNGDGRFTPGYDINHFVNDGWGVRDVFGAGFLFTGNYAAYMTKVRTPETRVLPPVAAPPSCVPERFSSLRDPEHSLGRYELRSCARIGQCAGMGAKSDSAFLHVMMRVNGFGAQTAMAQHEALFDRKFEKTISGAPNVAKTVALRWDERELGVTLSLFGVDVGEGWLVGRLHIIGGVSTEMMFTRSASRWSEGYFLGGWEWKNAYYETHDGVRVEVDPYRSEAVWETGVRLRIGLPEGPIRLLFLNQRFAGIRTGVRFNGVERLKNARFSLEFGSGVW